MKAWTKEDITELESCYSTYPISISPKLVLLHGRAGCYSKASKLGMSNMLRMGQLDLSAWTEATKAYIAGIIDGEGSIVITRNNVRSRKTGEKYVYERPIVTVANTSEILISYLNNLNIGAVCVEKRKVPRCKQAYQWVVSGRLPIYSFLKAIEPYLIIKKSKAQKVMAWIQNRYGLGD